MTIHRHFRDDAIFATTVDTVADQLDISATAVEKDYWVSQILRVLEIEFSDDFIFKGGTSLSKGYRIVERFSEDIDILVLPRQGGRAAMDKLMKAMAELTAKAVGGAETGQAPHPTGESGGIYWFAQTGSRLSDSLNSWPLTYPLRLRSGGARQAHLVSQPPFLSAFSTSILSSLYPSCVF